MLILVPSDMQPQSTFINSFFNLITVKLVECFFIDYLQHNLLKLIIIDLWFI